MGDAEYMSAFRSVVMPIATDFQPDIILVSCGFDAANGHPAPLGGYRVTPACFGWMTQQLMSVSNGKVSTSKTLVFAGNINYQSLCFYVKPQVVLALEGGYDLPAICDSAQECVKALLGEPVTPIPEEELLRTPSPAAVETLIRTISIQTPHWPCIKRYMTLVTCSAVEAASASSVEGQILLRDRVESETVSAMASLSMHHARRSSVGGCSSQDDSETTASINASSKSPIRCSSEINPGVESRSACRRDSEEPMDQDDEGTK